ncbi:MAG TPA: ABC transporter permease [Acidobacteriota bacterium]|nr:ABC transporter permease [Acidobacteriota bacterium]
MTRRLLRRPAVTLAVILLLAAGAGTNVALFAILEAVILRPLPFPAAHQLVHVGAIARGEGFEFAEDYFSPGDFQAWGRLDSFQELTPIKDASKENVVYMTGTDQPMRLRSSLVLPDFFPLLGSQPVTGRTFSPAQAMTEVVVSHDIWSRAFSRSSQAVGQTVRLNGRPYTVAGVMPADFLFESRRDIQPQGTDVWLLQSPSALIATDRSYRLIGRLKDGVDIEQARQELDQVLSRISSPGMSRSASLISLHELATAHTRAYLWPLIAAGGFVFLIAAVNAVLLLMIRSLEREREWAIRTALGAGRGRVLRESLGESALLTLAAALLSIPVSWAVLGILKSVLPPFSSRIEWAAVGPGALLLGTLTVGLAVAPGSLVLAFKSWRRDMNSALRQGISGGRKSPRRLNHLVVAEVAIAAVLLVGAGLLLRSFIRLSQSDPGFESRQVLVADIYLPLGKYFREGGAAAAEFYQALVRRTEELNGVIVAGVTSSVPLRHRDYLRKRWRFRRVDNGFFEVLDIKLVRGRLFSPEDGPDAQKVALVNQQLARTEFQGSDPIGRIFDDDYIVIGIVEDVRHERLDLEPEAAAYFHHRQLPDERMSLLVRTRGDPMTYLSAVHQVVRSLDADQPVANPARLSDLLEESEAYGARRFFAGILGLFSALALLLAAAGLYTTLAVQAAARRREMGVRLALGATRTQILRLLLREAAVLTGIGTVIGLVLSWLLAQPFVAWLYRVPAQDPLTMAAVTLLLLTVGLTVSFLPAFRSSRISPAKVLRCC